MRFLLVLLAVLLATMASAQELSGDCFTCYDTYLKCRLDCVMPSGSELTWPFSTDETLKETYECTDDCETSYNSCEDSDATETCISCLSTCTETFATEITACTTAVSSKTKSTFNSDQDYCHNAAAYRMESCTDSCLPYDRFDGWTPEKEDGTFDAEIHPHRFSIPPPSRSYDYGEQRRLPEENEQQQQEQQQQEMVMSANSLFKDLSLNKVEATLGPVGFMAAGSLVVFVLTSGSLLMVNRVTGLLG